MVIAGQDGALSLLDAEQGTLVWTLHTGSPLLSSSTVTEQNPSFAVFPGADGQLYGYEDAADERRSLTVRPGLKLACCISVGWQTQAVTGSAACPLWSRQLACRQTAAQSVAV